MVSRHDSLVGRKIGQFRVESFIGRGGFANVWRARHERLDRVAALKVLHSKFDERPEVGKRFVREGQVQARLRHPNIVDVFDADERDGFSFIALRFIEGEPLARRGRLPVDLALDVLGQVAPALDLAHANNVIHRDITPNNILLEGSGNSVTAYVTDFGLAAVVDGSAYTPEGVWNGTPSFFSPEELMGTDVIPRSDVFSFGCLAFYTLTGHPPFPYRREVVGSATLEVVRAGRQPNVSSHDESLRALDPVVKKAMAERPADRYATCSELVEALKDAAAGDHDVRRDLGGQADEDLRGDEQPGQRVVGSTRHDPVPTQLDPVEPSAIDSDPDEIDHPTPDEPPGRETRPVSPFVVLGFQQNSPKGEAGHAVHTPSLFDDEIEGVLRHGLSRESARLLGHAVGLLSECRAPSGLSFGFAGLDLGHRIEPRKGNVSVTIRDPNVLVVARDIEAFLPHAQPTNDEIKRAQIEHMNDPAMMAGPHFLVASDTDQRSFPLGEDGIVQTIQEVAAVLGSSWSSQGRRDLLGRSGLELTAGRLKFNSGSFERIAERLGLSEGHEAELAKFEHEFIGLTIGTFPLRYRGEVAIFKILRGVVQPGMDVKVMNSSQALDVLAATRRSAPTMWPFLEEVSLSSFQLELDGDGAEYAIPGDVVAMQLHGLGETTLQKYPLESGLLVS